MIDLEQRRAGFDSTAFLVQAIIEDAGDTCPYFGFTRTGGLANVFIRQAEVFWLHRDDVVLLQRDRGEVSIKRIFRLPGEEVPTGYPFLVGTLVPRGLNDYYEQAAAKGPGGEKTRYFVPKGYIAVLGDNPDVSEDSRFFGPVPVSSVIGTAVDAPGLPAAIGWS